MLRNIAIIFAVVIAAIWPVEAQAYIDPGTGSILIQGLIGAIAAIGVTLKLYWHRLVGFFRKSSSTDDESSDERINEKSGS